MKAQTKYFVDVPKVTIETMAKLMDDALDMNVSIDAEIDIEFGLVPGTYRISIVDTEEAEL